MEPNKVVKSGNTRNLVIGYVVQYAFRPTDNSSDRTALDHMHWRYQTGEDSETSKATRLTSMGSHPRNDFKACGFRFLLPFSSDERLFNRKVDSLEALKLALLCPL